MNTPTIGRIVIYTVPQSMKAKTNHADELPAVIVRVWSGGLLNLKVINDGQEDVWVTSVPEGNDEGQWHWPVITK